MADAQPTVVTNLADDLSWLETHARRSQSARDEAVLLRFAAALVRNVIAPANAGHTPPPLHVAVLGGAGSGKSTVSNLLCGAVVAEANPQAGYTRHPIVFASPGATANWPHSNGFLGPLELLAEGGSSNIDEDYYQIRTIAANGDQTLLNSFVVWDCPDMTTWASEGYAPRLLEVAALADVIAYVASDERYNDIVPTQYLQLLLESGKPIVVVLTKMKPDQADELAAHFKKEVLSQMPRGRVAVLTIPHLTHDELADPINKAARFRIPLVNQVDVLGEHPEALRKQNTAAAINFLRKSMDRLLAVARDDVAALEDWSKLVRSGQTEFEDRYRREYLSSAKFHRFDEALVRLIDLLEIPGAGKFLASTLYVVRTPYRLAKGFIGKFLSPAEAPAIPEQPVLELGFTAWMDQVRATALANERKHDLWAQVVHGFEGDLPQQLRDRFRTGLNEFHTGQRDEIDATARAIYEDLEKSPGTLNALRGGKLALDVAAITGSIIMGGLNWHDFILVPLAAAVSQQLVEWLGAGYVENQKEQARQRQQELVSRYIAQPVGKFLTNWPVTGGTSYERLQLALARIPDSLRQLAAIEAPH